MAPTPALLPGGSQGLGSLAGCRPWGLEESDTTERLRFHFSLSCIGEGNGISLQCSCLENPRDRGAWWAAVRGVPKSRTRLSDFTFTFRTRKQPRCPSTDEWIKKLWYIYTMEYYSTIKRNKFASVLVSWINLEPLTEKAMAPHSSTLAWKIP